MQGSYKTNGLPRPYYMKPHKRGVYENMARQNHLTNSRKLIGYLIMLLLFGFCMYMVGQELRGIPSTGYEITGKNILKTTHPKKNTDGDVKNFVQSSKNKDKVTEKDAFSNGNKESLDEYDNVVIEAPKGGLVNEAPIVGNDAGLVIDGKKSPVDTGLEKKAGAGVKGARIDTPKKGLFSASREGDEDEEADMAAAPAKAKVARKRQAEDDSKGKIIKNDERARHLTREVQEEQSRYKRGPENN